MQCLLMQSEMPEAVFFSSLRTCLHAIVAALQLLLELILALVFQYLFAAINQNQPIVHQNPVPSIISWELQVRIDQRHQNHWMTTLCTAGFYCKNKQHCSIIKPLFLAQLPITGLYLPTKLLCKLFDSYILWKNDILLNFSFGRSITLVHVCFTSSSCLNELQRRRSYCRCRLTKSLFYFLSPSTIILTTRFLNITHINQIHNLTTSSQLKHPIHIHLNLLLLRPPNNEAQSP